MDSSQHRFTVVFGTRPEAIKLAPVSRALSDRADVRLVMSGQHCDMVTDLLADIDLHPDINLGAMRDRQTLNGLASRLLASLGDEFVQHRPDAVIVQGDTTTATCAALAAFHEGIPVAHVEAGLRSCDQYDPFPEEANRRLISQLATWHFAPTAQAAANLIAEGHRETAIDVTGNTVIDNLLWARDRGLGRSAFRASAQRRVLVTLHRRETQGTEMSLVADAIRNAAAENCLDVVLPLHRNPKVRDSILPALVGDARIRLIEPLGYLDFIATLADASMVVTDSGGVLEEAPSLDVPVLIVRKTTERPEAIEAGCALLVGTDADNVQAAIGRLLRDNTAHEAMRNAPSPFGDGTAATRIAARLMHDVPRGQSCALAGRKDITDARQDRNAA